MNRNSILEAEKAPRIYFFHLLHVFKASAEIHQLESKCDFCMFFVQ